MKFLSKNITLMFIIILSLSPIASADEDAPRLRPAMEYVQNFGMMYGAQWAFYLISQEETIDKHGSFDNWVQYPTQPDFDKDSFDYNIFKHSLAGNYYYLFYRHQGYGELEAFTWTFLSSLAFEFTVETYTEKPSFQDIYQTPIYGTILGMGSERLSSFLLSSESQLSQFFGYILNPFNFLKPKSSIITQPILNPEAPGFLMSWRF